MISSTGQINEVAGTGALTVISTTATVTVPEQTILIFFFEDIGADYVSITIGANQAEEFDLDAAVLTNVATVVYEINTVTVTGVQTLSAGDTFEITITRTNDLLDSEITLTST